MIGKRLAEQRKKLGYSQQKLADLMGLGRSTLALIEACKSNVDLQQILNLREHGFDVTFIITGEPSPLAAAKMLDWQLVESILQGIQSWSQNNSTTLSPEKQALALKILYTKFAATGVAERESIIETLKLAA